MLSVGDIMTQFREQFKQEVGKLQKNSKDVRTSALFTTTKVCTIKTQNSN